MASMRKIESSKKTKLEELAEQDSEIKKILSEPVGTPVPKLTRDQAIAIVQAGIGTAPSQPTGVEYVRHVKKYWRSLMPRDRRPL